MMSRFQFCFNFAFKLNLRRYNLGLMDFRAFVMALAALAGERQVGWCRLTLSNPS